MNLMFQEGLLVIINQLCMSTVNVKRFLENGLMNSLMNLMLLSDEDDVRPRSSDLSQPGLSSLLF